MPSASCASETRPRHLALSPVDAAPAVGKAAPVRSVTVLTSGCGHSAGGMHAVTADSFETVSDDPPLVVLALGRASRMLPVVQANGEFAVSLLAQDQGAVARWFASRNRGFGPVEFASVSWEPGDVVCAPLLTGSLAWYECRLEQVVPTGDHFLIVGEVLLQKVSTVSMAIPLVRVGRDYAPLVHVPVLHDRVSPPVRRGGDST